jgi:hypothetical protein
MSKYKHPVTVFSEKKSGVINYLCIKLAHMVTLGLPFSNSHDIWIVTASNPAVVPVYSSTDMELRVIREARLAEEIGRHISSL